MWGLFEYRGCAATQGATLGERAHQTVTWGDVVWTERDLVLPSVDRCDWWVILAIDWERRGIAEDVAVYRAYARDGWPGDRATLIRDVDEELARLRATRAVRRRARHEDTRQAALLLVSDAVAGSL